MHKPNPEMFNEDNPELTDDFFAKARPAAEALPEIFGVEVAKQMLQSDRLPDVSVEKVAK